MPASDTDDNPNVQPDDAGTAGSDAPAARPAPSRLPFRPRHRLRHDLEFKAVFEARARKTEGPLTVFTRPSDLPDHRLGLSIGRRVGGAVRRNRLKRHLREAFRTTCHAWPTPPAGRYDVVVTATAHDPLPLDQYAAILTRLVLQCHRVWEKRSRRATDQPEPPPDPSP